VFLGTSAFAADVLRAMSEAGEAPLLVVTRPDRPRGRGRRVASPPVAEASRLLGLPVVQPERVNDPESVAVIEDQRPDAVCVCAFGALIKEPLLSSHPMLNVHPSLLPRWRGAAPIERAIMAGDSETGVSIMQLGAGLDDGPVALTAATAIGAQDDYGTLAERLAPIGAELLVRALREGPPFHDQDEAASTYAEKITAEDRVLDPGRPAVELERVVRALRPHVGAQAVLPDRSRLGVHASRVLPSGAGPDAGSPAAGVFAQGDRLLLGANPGTLELVTVQPPGGRAMDAAAFLRGHRGAVEPPG